MTAKHCRSAVIDRNKTCQNSDLCFFYYFACCSVFFSKMYEKNPFKIVDDKQYQQYKWLLNIVDLQRLIEKKTCQNSDLCYDHS